MKTRNPHQSTRSVSWLKTTLVISLLTSLAALPPGRHIGIAPGGTTGLHLELPGIRDAVYAVYAKSNLTDTVWRPLATVTGGVGVTASPLPATDAGEFYRVKFPEPAVVASEPARYAHGTGGSYLYVTGQFFYPGDQIWVQGVALDNVVFLSHNQLRGDLPPLPPGRYSVRVLSGHDGAVLAELPDALHVVDSVAHPDSLLYGPPEEPPASPTGLWMSKRGYDYYKAASDHAAAESGRDFFNLKPRRSPDPSASITVPDNGKGITERGIKLFDDDSAVAGITVPGSDKGISQPGIRRGIAGGVVAAIVVAARGGRDASEPTVTTFSGEVEQQVVDLAIPGRGLDFVWARSYHSRVGRAGSSANGWTFSYDIRCIENPAGGIDVTDGTGRTDTYRLQTGGVYTCPELFREGAFVAGVFRLTFADTGYWEFRSLSAATAAGKLERIVDRNGNTVSLDYDASGRLSTVNDDLGRAHTVAYDTAGRLASLTDAFGRRVRYEYDGLGDLVACVSPSVNQTPTGNDFPNGKTNHYAYTSGSVVEAENHLLLSCADALGQTTVQYGYDLAPASPSYLRCTSIRRGTHPPIICTYQPQTPTPDNRFAALRCIVNDSVGNVTEMLYDCRNRGIEKAQIKRRAVPEQAVTDTSFLTREKLRPEDPERSVTRWSWNNDSLCTSATAPGGEEVRCIYQGDLEPSTPARKRADCRVVREIAANPVDLNGDGTADATERVWTYAYDPRFGSTPCKGWDGSVKGKKIQSWVKDCYDGRPYGIEVPNVVAIDGGSSELRESPSGVGHGGGGGTKGGGNPPKEVKHPGRESPSHRTASGGNSPRIFGNPASGGWTGFVTSATDPRGNATEAEYDEQGNCRALIVPATRSSTGAITLSRVHDAFGQLIAITNAPDANGYRRVDTFVHSQGQVTACVVDAAANGLALTTWFEYDQRGNLTRCVDPRGNDWLYTYNSLDQCVRAQSPVNVAARCSTGFLYDANDNLVRCVTQVRDANDALLGTCTDRATYDELRRLTEVALAVDATHALTNRFVYDGNDRCVEVLGGDAVSGVDPHHAVAFEYDTCGLLYRETAAPGSADQCTTQYDYDVNDLVTRVSVGLEETPSITTLAYDGFAGFDSRDGASTSKHNWMGSVARLAYSVQTVRSDKSMWVSRKMMGAPKIGEATARLSQITDPLGNVTTFHYDANDNLAVARRFGQTIDVPGSDGNIRLAESRYEYDGLDRCVVQRDLHFALAAPQSPVGDGECTTAFAYAPNGVCIGITNDLGQLTSFAYDRADRVHAVSVPAGKSVLACVRDAAGNVTSVTQTDTAALGGPQQSFSRTYLYDSRNRCVSTTDGVGKTTSCAYDSLDRIVRSTDAAGTQTFHHYDLLGRRTLTVGDLDGDGLEDFASDITQQSSWSPSNGRLLSTTDSHGNTTHYEYDSRDRCTAAVHADGTQQQLVWSPRSNLVREIDPNGTTITNVYDLCDRVAQRLIVVLTDGDQNVATTTTYEHFVYDGCDRLTGHLNDACDGSRAYDSLGSCVRDTLNGLTTTSTYDALGNRLSLAYPGGRLLTYAYDASGGCTNIAESGASLASFAYDGVDRLARVTYANGLSSSFEYDGLDGVQNAPGDHGFGQISLFVHATSNGTPVKISHLSWDLKENKKARTMPPTNVGGSTNILTLEYDLADRLVRSTVMEGTTTLRDTTYSLDRMGNRTNVTGAACTGPYALDPAAPPADFQMNQYTTTPCETRSYDLNGNLVGRASTPGRLQYRFDYADRLVEVQSVVDGGTGGLITNVMASYTYDALDRRTSKTLRTDGLPPSTRHYGFDGSCVIEEREDNALVASYVGTCMSGQCVTMRRSGQDYYFLSDDQGNTIALTDANGAVVEGYDYDDYGAVTFLSADGTPLVSTDGMPATSSPAGNPYGWGGLRLDAETGLHNDDGGGYFEPQTGRSVARRSARNGRNPQTGKAIKISASFSPWSSGTPLGMKKGTVKFFNDVKSFGRGGQEKLDYVLNLIR